MGKERLVRVRGGFSNWSNEDILKFAGFVQRFWRKKVDAESCRFIDLYSPVTFAEKRKTGKISLRRMQWRLAEKNATMAIFLGKQYLGQRDNVDVNVTNTEGLSLDELETMVIGFDAGSGDSNSPE